MVLGEAQILGQVKNAYDTSCNYLPPQPAFERLLGAVFSAAKRSRLETEIGKGAVSVASAAVHLATRIFHDMSKRTVVVVGAGDTGRLVAEHFQAHRPQRTIIVNRTPERAATLAQTLGGVAWPWDDLARAIAEADVIACAVRSPQPVIDSVLLDQARAHRSGHPLAILDLGLPRNVALTTDKANVFVHDLDAFRQVVDSNLARRKKEIPQVEAIIEEEMDRLLDRHFSTQVGPLIAALRDGVESIRQAEVSKATTGLNDNERAAVDKATRAVIRKLLHGPTTSIKALARKNSGAAELEVVRELIARLEATPAKEPK